MCHGWELITSSFLKALKHLEIDDEEDDDDVDGVCDDDIKFAKNKPIKWNVSSWSNFLQYCYSMIISQQRVPHNTFLICLFFINGMIYQIFWWYIRIEHNDMDLSLRTSSQ